MTGSSWQLTAADLSARVRSGDVSACEVLDEFERRFAHIDPHLTAFCTPALDQARAVAESIDARRARGEELGLLAGVPLGVKDLIFTRGIVTTGGTYAYKDLVPDEDDIVVERVRAADAVIVGKTNVAELGYTGGSVNLLFGPTRNPWNLELSSGGSSSGSAAAVAAGLGPVALGSDGGGSIRVPASYCGVFGIKPTMGRVPLYPGGRDERYPGFSGWETLEQLGPLSRTVADAALVLDVIGGPDLRDRHSLPLEFSWRDLAPPSFLRGKRVAVSFDYGSAKVDPEIRTAVEEAARVFENDLGCHVDLVDPPFAIDPDLYPATVFAESDIAGMRALFAGLGDKVTRRMHDIIGREWTLEQINAAAITRKRVCRLMAEFMGTYDLLLTPTVPSVGYAAELHGPAEIAGFPTTPADWIPFTNLANLTGQPAASVPLGLSAVGLPIGLHIVGRHLADRDVMSASAAFEAARPWADSWPSLAFAPECADD